MAKPNALYDKYFQPGTRGHGYIHNFYQRYQDVFRSSDFTEPDALLNQIYLNLASILTSAIRGEEDHYVLKAIYFQCWKIFHTTKEKRTRFVSESRMKREDEDISVAESWRDERPLPGQVTQAQDLLELIQKFRSGLSKGEAAILNGMLDEWSATEISKRLKMNLSTVNVTVFRLRKKLTDFLADTGYRPPSKKT